MIRPLRRRHRRAILVLCVVLPIGFGAAIAAREGALLALEAEGGLVGWGETLPLAGFGLESADEARRTERISCARESANLRSAQIWQTSHESGTNLAQIT